MILKSDIKENKIFTVNNILSEQELAEFWFTANECGYFYKQRSNPFSNKNQKRLAHHYSIEVFVQTAVWGKIEKLFKESVGLVDAYINYSELASRTLTHSDGVVNEPSVLICLNEHWERDWGGYTVFFKGMSTDVVVKTIVPRPGQIVIFNGFNWHLALPPTIYAEVPRFMLALKLKYV